MSTFVHFCALKLSQFQYFVCTLVTSAKNFCVILYRICCFYEQLEYFCVLCSIWPGERVENQKWVWISSRSNRANRREPGPSCRECLLQGRYARPAWVLADRVAWFPCERSAASSLSVACGTVRVAHQIYFLLNMFSSAHGFVFVHPGVLLAYKCTLWCT